MGLYWNDDIHIYVIEKLNGTRIQHILLLQHLPTSDIYFKKLSTY